MRCAMSSAAADVTPSNEVQMPSLPRFIAAPPCEAVSSTAGPWPPCPPIPRKRFPWTDCGGAARDVRIRSTTIASGGLRSAHTEDAMGIGGAGTKRFVRTGGRYGVGSALVLGCLVIGGAASAQEPRTEYRGTSAQQMACTPDVFRL